MIEIFMLQLLFQLFRTLGTRYIVHGSIIITTGITIIIQALWLITTAIGVNAVMTMNWYDITGYMLGGVVGNIIAMKYNIKEV